MSLKPTLPPLVLLRQCTVPPLTYKQGCKSIPPTSPQNRGSPPGVGLLQGLHACATTSHLLCALLNMLFIIQCTENYKHLPTDHMAVQSLLVHICFKFLTKL